MKLNVRERLILLRILPKEGNALTLKVLRLLREDLSFSDEDLTELEFKEPGEEYIENGITKIVQPGQLMWKQEADVGKEIMMEPARKDLVVKSLKKLDREEKLTEDMLSLYEKFVED